MRFLASQESSSKIPASFNSFRASSESSVKQAEIQESQETLEYLKNLVPNIPHGAKVSKLELLQGVMDYIFELQQKLLEPIPDDDSESEMSQESTTNFSSSQTCRSDSQNGNFVENRRLNSDFDSLSALFQQIGSCLCLME